MTRDENDVQKLVATFNSGLLSDPFYVPDDVPDEEEPLPLSNLATGVILPDAEANRLVGAKVMQAKHGKLYFIQNPV